MTVTVTVTADVVTGPPAGTSSIDPALRNRAGALTAGVAQARRGRAGGLPTLGPMRVGLPYGRGLLEVKLPSDADVIEPVFHPGLADEAAAIRSALAAPIDSPPLAELVPRGARVGVVVCDHTRPFPGARILPVLAEAMAHARLTIFVATGTHRQSTDAELDAMLGPEVRAACRVVQHDAFALDRHVAVGRLSGTGTPILIDAELMDQDVRITTGFIEPHFFAGFSGGPKMAAPGLGAVETILDLHSAARIGSPQATWGITVGNPVHDGVREFAAHAGITFSLDVTLNRDHAITGVFAGDLFASHGAGCDFARRTAMAPVARHYDVVVTTNSGYPLDQNLYQSVKGMSAAAQIVRDGGAIVMAAECSDGLPEQGGYRALLESVAGPEDFLGRVFEPGFSEPDQWQVQVQAQIQRRASVYVKASGLDERQVRGAWFEPVDDVGALVDRLGGRVCVIPQGPQTIPYVAA